MITCEHAGQLGDRCRKIQQTRPNHCQYLARQALEARPYQLAGAFLFLGDRYALQEAQARDLAEERLKEAEGLIGCQKKDIAIRLARIQVCF